MIMIRYGLPIVLAGLYIAGASWIVHNEGRAYRASLNRANTEAVAAPAPPVAPPPVVEHETREEAPPEPASPSPEPAPARPIATAAIRPEPRKAEVDRVPTPAATTPPPAATKAPPATGELAARVSQWRNDRFWNQPDLVKTWDVDHLTEAEEIQLGEQLNRRILELNPEDTGPGLRRVKETAGPLLDLLKARGRYRFFVLNSDVANAFSHPGGYIYVSRKLLEMIPEDEPAPLEFVIGHEIAHLERHDALACLKAPDVRKFSDGTLQKLYFLILPHGYWDEFEYQADRWIYARMKQLRRTEYECLKFLRLLDSYAKLNGFENGRGKPEELLRKPPGEPADHRVNSPIDNHLRSHPAAYERLDRLKAFRDSRP